MKILNNYFIALLKWPMCRQNWAVREVQSAWHSVC